MAEPKLFTIAGVEEKEMPNNEMKVVVLFVNEPQCLVLNRVNAESIADIVGTDDSIHWRGVVIEIYPDRTRFGGKMVDCLRVRAPQNTVVSPPPVQPVNQNPPLMRQPVRQQPPQQSPPEWDV